MIRSEVAFCSQPNFLPSLIFLLSLFLPLGFSLSVSPRSFAPPSFSLLWHARVACLFWCVWCISVVRWQPAAATRSSPPWPRSQGRRAPTARFPLPSPAAPPLRGLTLTFLLTRYCRPHPGLQLPFTTTSNCQTFFKRTNFFIIKKRAILTTHQPCNYSTDFIQNQKYSIINIKDNYCLNE